MLLLLAACASDVDPSDRFRPPAVDAPVWTAVAVDDNVLARRLRAILPTPGPVAVRCEAAAEPGEVHELAADAGDRWVDLPLFGLLADTDYACVGRWRDVDVPFGFRTGSLPGWLPSFHVEEHVDPFGGYVLLNHGTDIKEARETKLLIVDVDGRLRWYRKIPYQAPDLDAHYLGDGYLMYGGGYAVPPTLADLSGRVWLRARLEGDGAEYNHHAERLADGTTLTILTHWHGHGGNAWTGFVLERLDPTLSFPVWRWNSDRGVEEGWLPEGDGEASDPYHANAAGLTDTGEVWVNLRQRSELHLLDPETGDRLWTLGPGKDFQLVDADGNRAELADWFFKPHAPEFHGDHVWLHDNGVGRPGGSYSRAVELSFDTATMTARVEWTFGEPGWYESIWGDVDVLPDGHVSITRGHCDHCVNRPDARSMVVEVDPTTNEVVWRLVFDDPHDATYRSERLDGCAIFANQRYCSTDARRRSR